MKKLVCLILVWSFTASLASAEVFRPEGIRNYSKSVVQALEKSSGKPLWQATIETTRDKDLVKIIETGRGIYGKDAQNIKWVTTGYYYLKPHLRPYQKNKTVRDVGSKLLYEEAFFFDEKNHKIYYEKNLVSGRSEKKELPFKEGTLDRLSMGLALSHFPYSVDKEIKFPLLTGAPKIINVEIKYSGIDFIQTGAGEFYCHKLELIPDLGILNIFQGFIPKTYFWYDKKYPHDFIKYDGLESGLGTPHIILERIYDNL